MERDIEALLQENAELKDRISEMNYKAFLKEQEQFQTMVVSGLMACVGQPSVKSISPAAITMLARMRAMKTLKDVHAYIEEFTTKAKGELEVISNEEETA